MQYNLIDLLVTMYAKVEELQQLGIAAGNPYLNKHIIKFVLRVIWNTRNFEEGMKYWHKRTRIENTWQHFKDHFEDKHTSLHIVRGTTMRSTAFHQASFLAAQVLNEVKDVITSVKEALLLLAEDSKHDDTHLNNRAIFVGSSTN